MTMQTQLTSDHTYTTTCGVCQTIAAHDEWTDREPFRLLSDRFILWSGGSGRAVGR